MPKVSKIPQFFYSHPVRYFIPRTHTILERAPNIIQADGFTKSPALEPAPMQPQIEPLKRSMTENLFFKKILIAYEANTPEHMDKIVFIITIDFSKGVCV